jgi:S1-C subfamily serine protease
LRGKDAHVRRQHQEIRSASMQTQNSPLAALSDSVAAIAKQAAQSAVALRDRGRWFSGFYWRPDVVATASELVRARRGESIAVIIPSQERIEGTVIGRDPSTDVALIRVTGTGRPVAPAAAPEFAVGAITVAAGRTRHGALCSVGSVALAEGPWRSLYGGDISARIWLDMRATAEAEGSAVLNCAGELIGMAVHAPRRRVLLIPAPTIERAGQELLAHGRVRRGYLGVGVQPVAVQGRTEDGASRTGLMVISLDPNGPALQAGVRQGDILLRIDGTELSSPRALIGLLRNADITKPASLELMRSGQVIRLEVSLGQGPPM